MTNPDTESADHVQRRGEAWELGLQGEYDAALKLIGALLTESSSDLVALRMKGNLLELKTLDLMEYSSKKLMSSRDYLAARDCYMQILKFDPQNISALIDLGDHYKNLDAYDKAFSFYEQAIDLLRSDRRGKSRTEELDELLTTCLDLGRQKQTAERAQRLKLACEQLLLGEHGS